ncbi:Transposase IS200 like [Gaiella occulta]|uniref:Transposase IS200 like n=1 Tax=Gaiella occulta TaxID=1002870 RepID=A0A7M2YVY5_9ACTN|nr:Transposase IS200 like [Gaiella occulta]
MRGNERALVFRDDRDRERFLEILGEVAVRYRWRVLAYCLMGNHFHLLVMTLEPTLARGMRQLNGVYAQWFNRRHRRVGHLFQGRYKAVSVQTDAHLRRTVRYVVRNPIRARLSSRPQQWRWTSHHATVGSAAAGIVAVDELLACFADDRAEALRCYRVMVETLEEPPPSRHPLVVGDDVFVAGRLACVPRDPEFTRAMLRPPRPTLDDLVGAADDSEGIVIAHIEHGYSLREIATHIGCSVTTVHRRVHAGGDGGRSSAAPAAGGTKKT